MEELKRHDMPTYGVRPWYVIVFGFGGLVCLVLGIIADTTSDHQIGLMADIWLLSSIALFVASLGAAVVSLLAAISKR